MAAVSAFAAVESPNIVGYATKEIAANTWYMIGCAFQDTNGSNLTIQNFATGMPETDDTDECAIMQVWNGTKLVTYTYLAYDWDADDNVIYAWTDAGGDAVDLETPPGFASWFKCPSAMTLTIAGQVAETNEESIPLSANAWQMIANPYPISVALNGANVDGSGLPQVEDAEDAAILQFWNGSKLISYTYMAYDWDADDNVIYAWTDAGGDATDLEIPVHTGFWIKSPTAATFKWKK